MYYVFALHVRGIVGFEVSYLSHTWPVTLMCGSSLRCIEPAAVCRDPSLNRSLWSSRTPHPAGCSPLTTGTDTHTNQGWMNLTCWLTLSLHSDTHYTDDWLMMKMVLVMMRWWWCMSIYTLDGGLMGLTGTHSSPAAGCTPVCPWGTWSGPCCRRL